MLFEQPGSRWQEPLLATRGEWLSLHRTTFQAEVEGGGGPLAIDDHLSLAESDADGRCIAVVAFDLDDIDAAYAELDARYDAGEATAHPAHRAGMRAFTAAVANRNWEPVLALCAPAFVEHDHRGLAVLGTTRGGEAWAQNFSTLTELAPDTVYRVDHFRSAPRGFCSVGTWHGTREGGSYEIPLIAVIEMDERDRMVRADIYDLEQVDQALARFEQLARSAAAQRDDSGRISPNTASRVRDLVNDAVLAGDWSAMRGLASDELVFEDRRRWSMTSGGVEMWLKSSAAVQSASGVALRDELIATVGDRIELRHRVVTGAGPDGGDFESEFLVLTQVDADGKLVASINFDADARAAASVEAHRRFTVGETPATGGRRE